MDLALIERLLDMFGRSPAAELELEQDGWRIRLAKAGAARPSPLPRQQETAGASIAREPLVAPRSGAAPALPAARASPAPEAPHVVVAGLVGTFFRRPSPDKPPFVEVGDVIEEGQTLGLMEAMKMLIAVEADRAGRIGMIYKEDGSPAQPGEPLFAIVPAGRP